MTPTAINNSIELKQDSAARQQALDVTRSFLVQAPAGSGKTELLTNRFLALLSVVDEPEQILAITFTRDATAEMRARVLSALQEAAAGDGTVAAAALERSRELGWALLEQPHRLNIQTIDSLCLQIAHEAPLLSRLGGQLQPTEDARPLYELAARRTLEQLGEGDSVVSQALQDLLRMRDVNVTECEGLIADLLCNRDQWLAEFPAEALHNERAWESLRPRLEEPLRREHDRVMRRVKELLSRNALHGRRLFELAAYACGNEPKVPLEDIQELMSVEDMITLAHFKCVRQFLLTGEGGWRKRVDKNHGFPTEKDGGSKEHKDNFGWLIQQLQETEGLLEALCALDELPAERYSDEEWRSIRSIFMVLVHAAAQLRVVFAERSAIDFVEAGMTAEFALHDPEVRRRWSDQIHHLLVDEFQDTSRRQYTLLSSIAGGWEHGEGKTCFLVGDPMQSIYLFRQADLALFNEVRSDGFGDSADAVTFENLSLRRNFRSSAGIVYPLNDMFTEIVGRRGTTAQFAPAVASADSPDKNAVHIFPQFRETGTVNLSGAREAEKAIEIIGRHIPAMERARAEGDAFRVGVLVRAKKHVAPIAAALRDAGIGYRAIEIETLDERQEIRDLLSLVRALLSPLDRIAWLSVLRAPWCGLSLCDLHTLSGSDDKEVMKQPIPELLKTRMALLSNDGAHRAKRIMKTLQLAIGQRFSGEYSASPSGFATWIERTWRSLGGAACVDANALENVGAFFKLLATVTPDGVDASKTLLEQRVGRLFAQPATDATEQVGVQLMTIHKAKGLGFDVVIVPALERVTGRSETPLLQWMARTREDSDRKELLIAPIGIKGDDSSPTYSWVARQRRKEEEAEQDRLLYVACTRAKSELHLFGTVCVRTTLEDGSSSVKMDVPSKRSLLGTGWPFFEAMFQEHLDKDRAEDRTGIFLVPKRSLETEQGFEMAASTRSAGQSLRRLPAHWKWDGDENSSSSGQPAGSSTIARVTSRRDAQAAGIVLHALFQQMASLDQDDVRRDLSRSGDHWTKVATALLRHAGLSSSEINAQLKRVLMMLQAAADDAHGRWMLGQHAKARSESAWTFLEGAVSRTVRADRVFVAGSEPLKKGESHLWIVDYKSTPIVREDDLFLEQERRRHEAQLATYGRVLRNAHAADLPIMLGLYYPSIPHLLWWPA